MADKVLSVLSLALLIGFCAFLVVYVRRIDLGVVVVGVVLMAAYDFWDTAFRRRNGNGNRR